MLYGEIIAVFCQIHTKHTNTLCGQNVEFVFNLLVRIVITGLESSETALFCDVVPLPLTWRHHAPLCLPDCTASRFIFL
jgi:hypothetical protein